ncbi:hypothetical protein D9M70_642510 [compost metagenome]
MAQALLNDVGRVLRGDVLALELDAALARVDDAADGLEDGGLARAVGAEHGGDLAAAHLQAHTADGLDGAVGALHIQQLEHRGVGGGYRHATTLWFSRLRLDTSSIEPR